MDEPTAGHVTAVVSRSFEEAIADAVAISKGARSDRAAQGIVPFSNATRSAAAIAALAEPLLRRRPARWIMDCLRHARRQVQGSARLALSQHALKQIASDGVAVDECLALASALRLDEDRCSRRLYRAEQEFAGLPQTLAGAFVTDVTSGHLTECLTYRVIATRNANARATRRATAKSVMRLRRNVLALDAGVRLLAAIPGAELPSGLSDEATRDDVAVIRVLLGEWRALDQARRWASRRAAHGEALSDTLNDAMRAAQARLVEAATLQLSAMVALPARRH